MKSYAENNYEVSNLVSTSFKNQSYIKSLFDRSYISISEEPKSSDSETSSTSSVHNIQSGHGHKKQKLVTSVTEQVLLKLSAANPHLRLSSSQFSETDNPTVSTDVKPEKCGQPLPYENKVVPIDLNDSFDRKSLLKEIPSASKKKAESLLIAFDDRPNELTWDSKGKLNISFVLKCPKFQF